MPIKILGIESSCDETSAAVISDNTVLSNIIANQDVHEKYGGVVPELASRAHQVNIIPVVEMALKKAGINKKDLDAIAYTRGPGLLGSLLVGGSFAKSLSLSLNIPLIEVNHMQAHILAHFIEDNCDVKTDFPFLGVNISGGHTQIVFCRNYFDMEIIGETLDDSIGEAFNDKFFIEKEINNLCASLQLTITEILFEKVKLAAKQKKILNIVFGGGVSANTKIRGIFKNENNLKLYFPKLEYTTDNAAMIAIVGYLKFKDNLFSELNLESKARYSI